MTYGTTPTPREMNLALQVWQVVVDAYNAGAPEVTLDDIVDRAGISPHLGDSSRRAYAATGVHWVRMALQQKQKMALVTDYSTRTYRLTNDPHECHEYYKSMNSRALTILRTAEKCLVGNTKVTKLARKSVHRVIEDLRDELAEATP